MRRGTRNLCEVDRRTKGFLPPPAESIKQKYLVLVLFGGQKSTLQMVEGNYGDGVIASWREIVLSATKWKVLLLWSKNTITASFNKGELKTKFN